MDLTVTGAKALTPAELRSKIVAWENFAKKQPQVEIPVTQYFSHGVYLRQINIPAGTIMTGKIHKHRAMSIVLSGVMEVVTDEGPRVVKGPFVFESPAGVKRAGIALTDCVWITAHPYDGSELDEAAMCDIYCVDTYEQLETFQRAQLEHQP